MMKPFAYSIWLAPCAEQCAALENLVCELSNRCGTPPFAPHATLCSGVWKTEEAALRDVVERLAARTAPVELAAAGIGWTDHWATFFFLRLTGAGDLFERASGLVEGSHPPPTGPHLSLLYRFGVPGIDREALRQALADRLPPLVRFDSLALICPATGRWEDVESWTTLHSACLSA